MKTIKTSFIFITLLLLSLASLPDTLTVKQDGTGDYTIIQNAIDATQNGDTILVYPGTYYENLIIENKNITVGSLILTTGNIAYIEQTIIDGSHFSGCIKINLCSENINFIGFVLKNGAGSQWGYLKRGGGVLINESKATVQDCIMKKNHATGSGGAIGIYESEVSVINCVLEENLTFSQGGGIRAKHSNIYLSKTTIKNNSAYWFGGGICAIQSQFTFDTTELCNIYNNTAAVGTDFYNGTTPPYIYNHVVIDTFTVKEPDYYYLFAEKFDTAAPGNTISWEIANGKLEQTSQNIYVANTGDNNNSGLTPNDPVKNIWFALLKMRSDSISPDTIVLADGIYAPSVGERFPLSLKRDVSLQGTSKNNTILDAENMIYHLQGIYYADNFTISDLTLKNGNGVKASDPGSVILDVNNNITFNNLLFTSNRGEYGKNCRIIDSRNCRIINSDFIDNKGSVSLIFGNAVHEYDLFDTNYIINCKFINNEPNSIDPGWGGELYFGSLIGEPSTFTGIIINSLFENNTGRDTHNGAQSLAVGATDDSKVYIINCTMADNMCNNPDAAAISNNYGSEMHIYNSIIYNNQYSSAFMSTQPYAGESNLYINNSLVEGGEENITLYGEPNNLFYDTSNIDTDPLFYYGPDFPYNLSNNSPCIDAGTLDLPEWIELPETDLAGNPRIYGETIDMGAYEWNPTVGIGEPKDDDNEEKLIYIAPNPVIYSTVVSVVSSGASNMKVEVYNNNGQRVAKIIDSPVASCTIHTTWDCTENGNRLSPGIYHIVLSEDGIEKDSEKLIVR